MSSTNRAKRRAAATIERLKPSDPKTPDPALKEAIRKWFFDHPTTSATIAEVAQMFQIKTHTAAYHVQSLLKKNALERLPKYNYRANGAYKTPEQIRAEIAKMPMRVQVGEPFEFGKPNGITAGSTFFYLRRHCESIKARLVKADFSTFDVEVFDEIIAMALDKKKPEAVMA